MLRQQRQVKHQQRCLPAAEVEQGMVLHKQSKSRSGFPNKDPFPETERGKSSSSSVASQPRNAARLCHHLASVPKGQGTAEAPRQPQQHPAQPPQHPRLVSGSVLTGGDRAGVGSEGRGWWHPSLAQSSGRRAGSSRARSACGRAGLVPGGQPCCGCLRRALPNPPCLHTTGSGEHFGHS